MSMALLSLILVSSPVKAAQFSFFSDLLAANGEAMEIDTRVNSQNMPLLTATPNPSLASKRTSEATYISGNSLAVVTGPLGTMSDVEEYPWNHQITFYTVRENDTLSGIAEMFDVSVSTILMANDIDKGIKKGGVLVILPVSGVLHTIKAGDTIKSIAAKYKIDEDEILSFNDLDKSSKLTPGTTITIPDADLAQTAPKTQKRTSVSRPLVKGSASGPYIPGYFIKPVAGVRTQGLHGRNAVDIGAPISSPIWAAADGTVVVAKRAGWNNTYGNYVVISHPNNTQTLYAHMSKVNVSVGDEVFQGDTIGYVGMTGHTTGPHVHFEVLNAANPFR